MQKIKVILIVIALSISQVLDAQNDRFHAGTAIVEYGNIAAVPGMEPLAPNTTFKISFDVAKVATPGEINRSIESTARFINMHVAAGVAAENIQLAVVVHGSAVKDMTHHARYQRSSKVPNANVNLIKVLHAKGVQFYVCGQSAAYHGVEPADLLPGVTMSLSAMTAHALLQQQGYSLNPF